MSCIKKPNIKTFDTIFGCFANTARICVQCVEKDTCVRRLVAPKQENTIPTFCTNCTIDMRDWDGLS